MHPQKADVNSEEAAGSAWGTGIHQEHVASVESRKFFEIPPAPGNVCTGSGEEEERVKVGTVRGGHEID